MSKRISINYPLNQVDINDNIAAIIGDRTPAVLAWYKVAQENLSSAEILLEHGKIPLAIFHIQQCVECFVKGTFLEAGLLSKENIIKINHHPADAYRELYSHIDSQYGLNYCSEIPKILNKGSNFTEKLILSARIANQFTTQYWTDFNNAPIEYLQHTYVNSTVLGLPDDTHQLNCHYRYLAIMYTQNMLLLLSYVFTHQVEQDARYPKIEGDKVIPPEITFDNTTIREGLPTILRVLRTLSNQIIGDSKI